ncbi:MAG TPA: LEPR-XLL domain-containing protein, partial [Isosphaeraceae bacterium]|nr:LEPR-XLL domain-containing protein [Isosphaeraceae bacterium]
MLPHLSWLRRDTNSRNRSQAHARRRRLWALEGLEDRVLLSGNPTIYTVDLTSDTGAGSGSSGD